MGIIFKLFLLAALFHLLEYIDRKYFNSLISKGIMGKPIDSFDWEDDEAPDIVNATNNKDQIVSFIRCDGCGANNHIQKRGKFICEFCGSDSQVKPVDEENEKDVVKIDKHTTLVRTLPEVPKDRRERF